MAFHAFPSELMQCPNSMVPTEEDVTCSRFDTAELFGTWNMIASTSNMWNTGKESIISVYTEPTEDLNVAEFASETSWLRRGSGKKNVSLGYSRRAEDYSSHLYRWRGASWLRFITTQWEVLGFGTLHVDTLDQSDCATLTALVTFVPKTSLSPQALSVLVNQSSLDEAQRRYVTNHVSQVLLSLNWEALSRQVDQLQIIP